MIVILDWELFNQYLSGENIFVEEFEDRWVCVGGKGGFINIKCVVKKSEDTEKNIMFVEKYLNDPRVFKTLAIDEEEMPSMITNIVPKIDKYSSMVPEESEVEDEVDKS